MSTTGTSTAKAAAKPGGASSRRTTSTPGNKNSGGPSSVLRAASIPRATRTPVPGSPASVRSAPRLASAQRRTSSAGPANDEPHIALAAREVVSCGGAAARMRTSMPLSASSIAHVSPITPAPMTSASAIAAATYRPRHARAARGDRGRRRGARPSVPAPVCAAAAGPLGRRGAGRRARGGGRLEPRRHPRRSAWAPGALRRRWPPRPSTTCPTRSEAEGADGIAVRTAALPEAQPSLRPVTELRWQRDGLHLRLTAQGPWELDALLALARSV